MVIHIISKALQSKAVSFNKIVLGVNIYLFESHENLLPLAEVSEEKVQGSRHEGRVIMHGQMQEDP